MKNYPKKKLLKGCNLQLEIVSQCFTTMQNDVTTHSNNKVETHRKGTGNTDWNWKHKKKTGELWTVGHILPDTVHCLLPHRPYVIVRLWLAAGAVHSGISNRSHWPFNVRQQSRALCPLPHVPLTHTHTDISRVRGLGSPNLFSSAKSPK